MIVPMLKNFFIVLHSGNKLLKPEKHMIVMSTLSTALVILWASCRKGLKDFTFSYSMENIDDQKIAITVTSNKSYRIERFHLQQEPEVQEGIMEEQDYKLLKKLLVKSNFFKMKDNYGSVETTSKNKRYERYRIFFSTKGKEKHISINNSESEQFSDSFMKLTGFLNSFLHLHTDRKVG